MRRRVEGAIGWDVRVAFVEWGRQAVKPRTSVGEEGLEGSARRDRGRKRQMKKGCQRKERRRKVVEGWLGAFARRRARRSWTDCSD